jgi:aryl-alcohol dehydrogenase-like predicted oxidoreductase
MRSNAEDELQQRAVFARAVRCGVKLFDAADAPSAPAERLYGMFHREVERTDVRLARSLAFGVQLTSSTGSGYTSYEDACRKSLERTGLVQLDIVHAPPERPQLAVERWEALAELHRKGLCRTVGVSHSRATELRACAEFLAMQKVPVACTRAAFSLAAIEPLEDGLVDACAETRIALLAYEPLGPADALSGAYSLDRLPRGARGCTVRRALSSSRGLILTIEDMARAKGATVGQIALSWVMAKGAVPVVVPRSLVQLEEYLGACAVSLTGGEVAELDVASRYGVRKQGILSHLGLAASAR